MKTVTLIIALTLLFTINLSAETIELLNGKTIEGQIVRTNTTSITLRTSSGVQTYNLKELAVHAEQPSATTVTTVCLDAESNAVPHSNTEEQEGLHDIQSFLLHGALTFRAGQILWLIGSVVLIIQGFRTSILWGVLILFTNLLGSIAFSILHPKRAVVPLLIMLVGIVVFVMAPFWALWGAGIR